MSIELETALALTAKLQRAEERAVAAELLIAEIDSERNSFTGAAGCEDRDGAVERLIKAGPNLTAAREMMRKASNWDTWHSLFDMRFVQKAETPTDMDAILDAVEGRHNREADTLRRQLAEAEANVAQLETFLDIQPRTPAAALAEYRREVLEAEADYCESMGDFETAHLLRKRKVPQ